MVEGGGHEALRVGLYADRLTRGSRGTGIGTYIAGLVPELMRQGSPHRFIPFSAGQRVGEAGTELAPIALSFRRTRRAALQLSWALLGAPNVDNVDGRLDLLHVLVPALPVPTRVPLVVTIHDLMPLKYPRFFSTGPRLLYERAIRYARRHADRYIAVSAATRRDVIEILGVAPDRVDVVHLAPRPSFGDPPHEEVSACLGRLGLSPGRFFVFVGEVAHRKAPGTLVEAFALVRQKHPDTRLVLVGSPGIGAAEVEERIESLRLRSAVDLLGHASVADVNALVRSAAALVLPSIDEGFGLPVLEAMSIGTAVVVSNAGSLPEVVGQGGVVVPVQDTERLADALGHLLDDDAWRGEIARAGRHRASDFSWHRAAQETLAVYDRVTTLEATP
jgi:glycosyltransferase involved in cell wall biosynthesis